MDTGTTLGTRSVLRIDLAHGFALRDRLGVSIPAPNRKANAILAFLALGPSASAGREKLTGLLWSEQDEETARAALRQCCKRLRGTLSEGGLETVVRIDRSEVGIDRAAIVTDLDEAIAGIAQGRIDADLGRRLDPDEMLHGFDALDPAFTGWLRVARQSWRDRLKRAVEAAAWNPAGSAELRLAAASVLLDLDPASENAARLIIEHELRRGEKAAALAVYERLWRRLDEDWGEEPSEELQAIIVAAKSGAVPAAPPEPLRPPAPPVAASDSGYPTIHVPAFHQNGPWQLPEYLVHGFRRELIASLVRFREWIVMETPPAGCARSDYELSGGYQQVGSGALLTLTLQDRRTGRYMMSEQFVASADTWGGVMQKTLRKLSFAINTNLIQRNPASGTGAHSLSGDTFELWLRANHLLVSWRRDRFEAADAIFREIIRRAPTFAAAYSSASSILSTRHLGAPGLRRDREAEALDLAATSVALDPLDSRNHLALAWAQAMRGSYAQAELHFEHSSQLNPNSAKTLVPCAQGLSYCGSRQQAELIVDQAIELHPDMLPAHWGYIMCIRFFAGRYAEAVAAGDRAGDSVLDFSAWRAAALALNGDRGAAAQASQAFFEGVRSRWAGAEQPTSAAIMDWFLHCFPIRRDEDRRHLREGLRAAGLPVPTE